MRDAGGGSCRERPLRAGTAFGSRRGWSAATSLPPNPDRFVHRHWLPRGLDHATRVSRSEPALRRSPGPSRRRSAIHLTLDLAVLPHVPPPGTEVRAGGPELGSGTVCLHAGAIGMSLIVAAGLRSLRRRLRPTFAIGAIATTMQAERAGMVRGSQDECDAK